MTSAVAHALGERGSSFVDPSEAAIAAATRRVLGDVPVILCGSRASGSAGPESDYDVVVAVPWRRLPFVIRPLAELSAWLTQELGSAVTINPVPVRRLQRRVNLFIWKVTREGRVLAAPSGFSLPRTECPPISGRVRFSYLMTGVFYLLSVEVNSGHLAVHGLESDRLAGKALLNAVQLRLMSREGEALAVDAQEQLVAVARLSSLSSQPRRWFAARDVLLRELEIAGSADSPVVAVKANLRYVVIAAFRGRMRWSSLFSRGAVDRRYGDAAIRLARSVAESGGVEASDLRAVRSLLPWCVRRRSAPTLEAIRGVLLREWPDAHPVIAQ